MSGWSDAEIAAYWAGIREGICSYAWWSDGVQQVGTTGTTLKQALAEVNRAEQEQKERWAASPSKDRAVYVKFEETADGTRILWKRGYRNEQHSLEFTSHLGLPEQARMATLLRAALRREQ